MTAAMPDVGQSQPSVNEEVNKYQTEARIRKYIGPMKYVFTGLSIFWVLFLMYFNSIGSMEAILLRAWTLGFLFIFTFLLFPASKRSRGERKWPTVWDIVCILLALFAIIYFLKTYTTFAREWGGFHRSYWNFISGGVAIVMLFEASRRVVGYVLTILVGIFLLYAFIGPYIPGTFGHAGFSITRIIDQMVWGQAGIFGIALGVFTTFVFMFVLFGSFLKNSGFTDFINDMALTVAGRSAGGPAKVAVIGSGFMGMVNGSAIGNVVTTGAVSIPLMKKTGYQAHFAGAVEATASTGGQFAPPVMGAAAFVMAEFIGVPYTTIMLAALIPAFLYFLTVFMAVHFEAKKIGLTGISKEHLPEAFNVFKNGGHLLLPMFVLVYLLVSGTTPTYAAVFALLTTVVVSWFRKSTRMGLKAMIRSMEEGCQSAISVGVACAMIGILVGVVTLTSLGLVISQNILSFAGESLFIAGILTMIISIIMGMGVPATAAYIIVATVSAPLLTQLGASVLVAHMFAFFYAALSNITPPVALASFAASGLAGASPNKVSLTAVRLGITGFIIPYFFLFNPVLLFDGTNYVNSITAMITASFGVVALAAGMQGWFRSQTNWMQRVFMLAAGFLLIFPGVISDIIGIWLIIAVYMWQKWKSGDGSMTMQYKEKEMNTNV